VPVFACRVCKNNFFDKPLLSYKDMPKGAQNFPDSCSLKSDAGVDISIYQCSGCGLVQLSNDPVPYYREVIRAVAFSDVIKAAKTKQFMDFINKYSLKDKKIIEIGCGRGEFLSLLKPLDVMAYGLEFSDNSVGYCKKNGLNVQKGYLDDSNIKLKNSPFDAFLLLMFLEHMPDPNTALRAVYNNLSEGGVGIVEVPNFDMFLRNKLFSEFVIDHLLYFVKDTLRVTLFLNGFEVLESNELRDDYVISFVVKKRAKTDIKQFYDYQLKITSEINEYINRFGKKRIAIWGASHQALFIISLTKISDKIKYVIDSALFKQGKYTPATHVPVVSPDLLDSDPVDAVIIMAASYSDEVLGIIRQRFSKDISIAILRDFGLEICN
jgi:SAM-dependent methyltransferase